MSIATKFETLFENLIKAIPTIKAVIIADRDGLVIASKINTVSAEENVIGTITATFGKFLERVKREFGTSNHFFNIVQVDQNKLVFITTNSDAILSILTDPTTDDNRLKVYSQHIANKARLLLEREEVDLSLPLIIESLAKMRRGELPQGVFTTKAIVLGDPLVGKTSLIRRFVDSKFAESYISTIGVDILRKDLILSDKCQIQLTLWDIGGQMQTMVPYRKRFYQGANHIFLIFDITRKKTFDNLNVWLKDLKSEIDKDISMVIIANKTDLPNHEVSIDEIKNKAALLQCEVVFCSAKTGSNVDDAFYYAGYKYLEKL